MAGWTNKGKYQVLAMAFENATEPTSLYVALVTSAAAPTADTNTLSQLTQIATGNGYTDGGKQLTRNNTNFTATEDDVNDRGQVVLNGVSWTASGGPIPASGNGARYAVLTDDNVTVGSREVYAYWDLTTDRTVSDTQVLTLTNPTLRANEA